MHENRLRSVVNRIDADYLVQLFEASKKLNLANVEVNTTFQNLLHIDFRISGIKRRMKESSLYIDDNTVEVKLRLSRNTTKKAKKLAKKLENNIDENITVKVYTANRTNNQPHIEVLSEDPKRCSTVYNIIENIIHYLDKTETV